MFILLLIFYLISFLYSAVYCEYRLVNLVQGPVRGYKDQYYNIFVFHSIPYATAPKGRDKFKVFKINRFFYHFL